MASVLTAIELDPLFEIANVTGTWDKLHQRLLNASDDTTVLVTPKAFNALAQATNPRFVCRYDINTASWHTHLYWHIEGAWLKVEAWYGACNREALAIQAIEQAREAAFSSPAPG